MIMDSRYPLLSENTDGSVLVPLHSVLTVIECKTRITTTDVRMLWRNAQTITDLASEVPEYVPPGWRSVGISAFAYRSRERARTLAKNFFSLGTPEKGNIDLHLLRPHAQDIGALFHFERGFPSRDGTKRDRFRPYVTRLFTPLSDLYYHVVQCSYYCLEERGYSFGDIGRQVMDYMSWSTYRPDRFDIAGNRPPKAPAIQRRKKLGVKEGPKV